MKSHLRAIKGHLRSLRVFVPALALVCSVSAASLTEAAPPADPRENAVVVFKLSSDAEAALEARMEEAPGVVSGQARIDMVVILSLGFDMGQVIDDPGIYSGYWIGVPDRHFPPDDIDPGDLGFTGVDLFDQESIVMTRFGDSSPEPETDPSMQLCAVHDNTTRCFEIPPSDGDADDALTEDAVAIFNLRSDADLGPDAQAALEDDLVSAGVERGLAQVDIALVFSQGFDMGQKISEAPDVFTGYWIGFAPDLFPPDVGDLANISGDIIDLESIELLRFGDSGTGNTAPQNLQTCATLDNQNFCFLIPAPPAP